MRIETQRYTERFGSVRLNDVQQVLELDSGRAVDTGPTEFVGALKIDEGVINSYEQRMAIAIPIMDEKLKLFEGVVSGIPHDCLLIVVSNSQQQRVDRFRMEKDALRQYCHFTRREALILHQKDPVLADALKEAGHTELLGDDGLLRSGKSEAMMAAMLMAMVANKEYIGFIDSDNYFPGSVLEYARCYAAGFSLATSPYAMVRILWRYKPKVSAGIFFRKWGRVSEISNRYMNSLISANTGFDTEIVKTSNAGEHAMSLALAELLPYASGYAVEPQELLSIFEGFSGVLSIAQIEATKQGVEILQIESRNPHLHEEKGVRHLQEEMLLPGLSAIYHSKICDENTRKGIIKELKYQKILKEEEEIPPQPKLYKALRSIDLDKFREYMADKLETYSALAVD
ncbi:MAG: mannosyl-3-phosphoglycerate synthase [Dehalococcoidales bacterium]|nr:mannosyl-3-phosphoglycerate synthase [Dehalococcoidales bacterium]